jgi:hypothetical protein
MKRVIFTQDRLDRIDDKFANGEISEEMYHEEMAYAMSYDVSIPLPESFITSLLK